MSGFRHTRHESHTLVRLRSIVGLDGPGITRTVTNKAIFILSLSSKTDACAAIMGPLLNHVWYETRSLIPTPRHLNLLYEIPVNQTTFDMLWLPNQGGPNLVTGFCRHEYTLLRAKYDWMFHPISICWRYLQPLNFAAGINERIESLLRTSSISPECISRHQLRWWRKIGGWQNQG